MEGELPFTQMWDQGKLTYVSNNIWKGLYLSKRTDLQGELS